MQQVKKQLQDAIKKLKADWGINEVKREDLAAILEKVVAAVDRAAQLPVAPAPVGGVKIVEGYTLKFTSSPNIMDTNAPSSAKPAIGVYGSMVFRCFFDAEPQKSYTKDSEGVSAYEFMRDKILSDGLSLCYISSRDDNTGEIVIRSLGTFTGEDPSFHV